MGGPGAALPRAAQASLAAALRCGAPGSAA